MSSKRSRGVEVEESSWCTIESDPGIFTLLIEKLGVKGVQVEEIYDLESVPPQLQEPFGFIFLFKWVRSSEKEVVISDSEGFCDPEIFFAKQEIKNACATQAILHILLNFEEVESVQLGQVLDNFKGFAKDLPSDMRGLCLSNSLEIRQIHNEFGNLEDILAYGGEEKEKDFRDEKDSKDPFHFVAFIKKKGKIYELDGLKAGPILHGALDDENWTEKVLEIIKKRVEHVSSEIRFNLMALVGDRRSALKTEIADLTTKIEQQQPPSATKTELLSLRFKAQQDLEDEEEKWREYRKTWQDGKGSIQKEQKLSPKVQDFLNSMTSKGLFQNLK